jgi:hypothetical protein
MSERARVERDAAIGLRAHSGWAVLVAVGGPVEAPTVFDRRRIELADAVPAQPYHHAVTMRDPALSARVVDRAREDAGARAGAALSAFIADAKRVGYDARRAALLVSRARQLPPLEAILRSHPLLHTAEGELFRAVLRDACERCGLAVTSTPERDVYEWSSRTLGMTPTAVRKRVAAIGRLCGSPWDADYKAAFLAAWALLAI